MTKKIEIEWTSDVNDCCETCGESWAEGATVKLNGEVILHLVPAAACYNGEVILHWVPAAACYDGDSWSESQVYKMILEKLGYEVSESNE